MLIITFNSLKTDVLIYMFDICAFESIYIM
jgi:hypothetical protein